MSGNVQIVALEDRRLLQMSPLMAEDDVPNLRGANPEPLSDSSLRHPRSVGLANSKHVSLGDLRRLVPSLAHHVVRVVLRCTQEEVAGPNARGVVTMMKKPEVFRNRPEVKFPREPRCLNPARIAALVMKFPVAFAVFASQPSPAAVRLLDFRPEALFRRDIFKGENSQGVAVPLPSRVVHFAPTTGVKRLSATRDATLGLHRKDTPFGVVQPEVIRLAAAFILPHAECRCGASG